MAAIPRKTQLLFGDSVAAAGNIGVFGSLAAGSPAFSKDPAVIQSLPAFLQAWSAAVTTTAGGPASPAMEDFNALLFLIFYQLQYIFQAGQPEWDAGTAYTLNSFVRVAGVQYVSKQDNNTNHLVTDTNWWTPYAQTLINQKSFCKAWVTFDGTTGAIADSLNVASVGRTSAGSYLVNFTAPFANALYAGTGSCGTNPGGAFQQGDDNLITFAFSGQPAVKSASQISVYCSDPNARNRQDSSCITLLFFGS